MTLSLISQFLILKDLSVNILALAMLPNQVNGTLIKCWVPEPMLYVTVLSPYHSRCWKYGTHCMYKIIQIHLIQCTIVPSPIHYSLIPKFLKNTFIGPGNGHVFFIQLHTHPFGPNQTYFSFLFVSGLVHVRTKISIFHYPYHGGFFSNSQEMNRTSIPNIGCHPHMQSFLSNPCVPI